MAEVIERKKKTRGRQKIEMKLIPDKEDRVITFSKRKSGKAYSFGHPSVKSVAEKFHGGEESERKQIREILETHLNNRLENQVVHHQLIKSEIEAINGQVSALADVNKFQNKGWWEVNVNEINSKEELEQMLKSVKDLQAALSHHFENLKLKNVANQNNVVPVEATYDPVGDVNTFLQNNVDVQNLPMVNWNGEFNNSMQEVNVAVDQPAVGFGGDTVGFADCGLTLPEAGFGDGLGQGGDFTLPVAGGGYDATFGVADDISGWSGLGYERFSGGAGLSGTGASSGAFGVLGDGAGLSGVHTDAGAYFGEPGDGFYASGFGDNIMNGLPEFP